MLEIACKCRFVKDTLSYIQEIGEDLFYENLDYIGVGYLCFVEDVVKERWV
jgi:hypothetical protein